MAVLRTAVLLVSTTEPEPVWAVQHGGPIILSGCSVKQGNKTRAQMSGMKLLRSSRAYADLLFNTSVWLRSTLLSGCCTSELQEGRCKCSWVHRRRVGLPPLLPCVYFYTLSLLFFQKHFPGLSLNIPCFVFVLLCTPSCWYMSQNPT